MEYVVLNYFDGLTEKNVCYCYDLKIVGFGDNFEDAIEDLESSVRGVFKMAGRFPECSFISRSKHHEGHREMFESILFDGRGPDMVHATYGGILFNVYSFSGKRFFKDGLRRDKKERGQDYGLNVKNEVGKDDVIEEDDIPF